jgi:hypothetical protein
LIRILTRETILTFDDGCFLSFFCTTTSSLEFWIALDSSMDYDIFFLQQTIIFFLFLFPIIRRDLIDHILDSVSGLWLTWQLLLLSFEFFAFFVVWKTHIHSFRLVYTTVSMRFISFANIINICFRGVLWLIYCCLAFWDIWRMRILKFWLLLLKLISMSPAQVLFFLGRFIIKNLFW